VIAIFLRASPAEPIHEIRAMAEVLYYVVRLEVLSWKIAKHGSVSSILEILYVSRERRANGRHGASPTTLTEVGAVQGLMAPKVREFRRVFQDTVKQSTYVAKVRRRTRGPGPGATPDWELTSWPPASASHPLRPSKYPLHGRDLVQPRRPLDAKVPYSGA
jgi:hypothetical protein